MHCRLFYFDLVSNYVSLIMKLDLNFSFRFSSKYTKEICLSLSFSQNKQLK